MNFKVFTSHPLMKREDKKRNQGNVQNNVKTVSDIDKCAPNAPMQNLITSSL